MLLCERSWNANFMKFEPKCQKFILVSIPIIAKSIYAAKTVHKLQIWTLVENLGPKRQILAQNWTLKIMVTMANGPFMLWFCEKGPPRLSKYWVWKKLKTHYKMGLVHPGTFSQKTGLKIVAWRSHWDLPWTAVCSLPKYLHHRVGRAPESEDRFCILILCVEKQKRKLESRKRASFKK